jgi:hypothetical protein
MGPGGAAAWGRAPALPGQELACRPLDKADVAWKQLPRAASSMHLWSFLERKNRIYLTNEQSYRLIGMPLVELFSLARTRSLPLHDVQNTNPCALWRNFLIGQAAAGQSGHYSH